MRSPLSSVDRYAPILLFIFIEIICFIIIVSFNQRQNEIFIHSASLVSGSLLKRTSQLKDLASLQSNNQELLSENARLVTDLINNPPKSYVAEVDTSRIKYEVIPSRVISNSLASVRNYITLDKGMIDGINGTYGVICNEGVIGILNRSTQHFSSVMSLLNVDMRISASIEGLDYFGSVSWNGYRYDQLQLTGIPTHAPVKVGDQVITNGYSTLFPHGIDLGTIENIKIGYDGAFFDIGFKPAVNLGAIQYAYVIKHEFGTELDSLQL